MAILGLVVGSGFITGKEIVVFFSRFGYWSFLTIPVAFFIFYFLFTFVLNNSQKVVSKIGQSKIAMFTNIILCTIFSSSMFGGINNLINFNVKWIKIAIFCLILFICLIVFVKGGRFFNKLNFILVPFMAFMFVVLLTTKLKMPTLVQSGNGSISIFYCILYCILNVSNGCIVIADLGANFSKKQKARVAFASALVLSIILLLTDIVLLSHSEYLNESMPLVSIFTYGGGKIISLLVFIGCLTTLLSTIYSSSSCMRGAKISEKLNLVLSIVLPLILSFWGFSNIVQYLYPLASVLGGMLMLQLFFIPSFKRSNKKVHCSSEQAKDKNAGHDNI